MISGDAECRIKEYLFIDHCGDGYGWTKPEDGEEFWGIPYQWHGENSMPFIEHRRDGVVTHTINAQDVSSIEFSSQRNPSTF